MDREKLYDAICWIAFGVLMLFVLVVVIMRSFAFVAIAWLFISSKIPWWFRVPAAIVVFAGLAYLLTKKRRRIPPSKKFLD